MLENLANAAKAAGTPPQTVMITVQDPTTGDLVADKNGRTPWQVKMPMPLIEQTGGDPPPLPSHRSRTPMACKQSNLPTDTLASHSNSNLSLSTHPFSPLFHMPGITYRFYPHTYRKNIRRCLPGQPLALEDPWPPYPGTCFCSCSYFKYVEGLRPLSKY